MNREVQTKERRKSPAQNAHRELLTRNLNFSSIELHDTTFDCHRIDEFTRIMT